jgi:formate dehydrogenase subunit gamma
MESNHVARIERHFLMVRIIHWTNAFCFIGLLLTALALLGIKNYEVNLWGYFYPLNRLLGGTHNIRWAHRFLGLAFFGTTLGIIIIWIRDVARFSSEDWQWLRQIVAQKNPEPPQDKLNAGQKVFFFAITILSLSAILSGLYIWLPWFDIFRFKITLIWHGNLHDYLIIPFLLLFLPHLYLALIAYPRALIGMITGYIPKEYAQKRHQKWYQDKMGHGDE